MSQGARPIGPELAITAADGNVIHELASRPALERLRQAIAELEPAERALAAEGVLLGIVVDPNKPDYDRGDFLIRGLLGADEETGAVTVGASVRLGQTVRLQVRNAESAHDDLVDVLGRHVAAIGRPPAGALLFTGNGRGSRMFGTAGHDARAVADAFAGAPSGGFFYRVTRPGVHQVRAHHRGRRLVGIDRRDARPAALQHERLGRRDPPSNTEISHS